MLTSEWRGTWLTHVTQEAPRVDGVKSSEALRGLGIGRLRGRGGREAAGPCPGPGGTFIKRKQITPLKTSLKCH